MTKHINSVPQGRTIPSFSSPTTSFTRISPWLVLQPVCGEPTGLIKRDWQPFLLPLNPCLHLHQHAACPTTLCCRSVPYDADLTIDNLGPFRHSAVSTDEAAAPSLTSSVSGEATIRIGRRCSSVQGAAEPPHAWPLISR